MKKINQKGKCNARKCNCLHEHNSTRKNRNDHHNTVLPCWLEKADIVFLRCHPLPSRDMTRIKTQIREGQRMFPTVRIPISQSFCLILSVDSVSNYAENGQKRAERARAACLVPSSFAWFLLRNKGLREAQSRIVCKDQNVREILAKNEFMPFPATISCRLIDEWNKIAMTLIQTFFLVSRGSARTCLGITLMSCPARIWSHEYIIFAPFEIVTPIKTGLKCTHTSHQTRKKEINTQFPS